MISMTDQEENNHCALTLAQVEAIHVGAVDNQESPSKELDAQKGGDLSDKLLPCPFCGSNDLEIKENRKRDFSMKIRCNSCKLFDFDEHACRVFPDVGILSIKCAIETWNTRAPSAQLLATEQALDTAREGMKKLESAATINFNDRMKINTELMDKIEILYKENKQLLEYKFMYEGLCK